MIDSKKTLTVVAAALLDQRDQVLMQKRPDGASLAGLWEFPGGKAEAGETPERALARELEEELGIEVAERDLIPVTFTTSAGADRNLLLLLFACRIWRGEPVALHASAIRWEPAAALAQLDMPPADYPMADVLRAWLAAGTVPLI